MNLSEQYFTPAKYTENLQNKIAQIKSTFADFDLPEMQVFTSPIEHYRQRAEFKVWHEGEDIYHLMYEVSSGKVKRVRMDTFASASKVINKTMLAIMPILKYSPILRDKLFQIEYLSNIAGDILVTLIYHKKLDDKWFREAEKLAEELNIELIGRSRKQKLVIGKDYLIEKMHVGSRELIFKQIENSFTQPNALVAEKMLNWVHAETAKRQDEFKKIDLLELYSGNSFFSIGLANNFNKILGVEVSKISTEAATYNIQVNNLNNVSAINAKSESIAELLASPKSTKTGLAFSMEQFNINLRDYNFDCVLVDPPRKGLDSLTLAQVKKFNYLIYVSCNINTLKSNLLELKDEFKILSMAFFDQFPYTDHMELGMLLQKVD